MSLKYTCPGCGTPLGYEGLCWKCKSEQERKAALAWMPEQIVEKQRNLIQNIQRLADMEDPEKRRELVRQADGHFPQKSG